MTAGDAPAGKGVTGSVQAAVTASAVLAALKAEALVL